MFRLPMGGTDFSIRPYTYDDFPDDYKLSQFNLALEDKEYKVCFVEPTITTWKCIPLSIFGKFLIRAVDVI